jgi:SAM-dependent methyltransferase
MLNARTEHRFEWRHGTVALSRNETHDRVVEMMAEEPGGKVLDVPTGTGILAERLQKMGFDVRCCDINPDYFSAPGLKVEIGDLNGHLPYGDGLFDYVLCIDGIEHVENPFHALREFRRVLKKGGRLFLSIPNYLNIERRLRFLFMGTFSKIPSHETVEEIWKGDLSMAHLSPLGYPLLKFMLEHYGFRILRLEKDRKKRRMIWLKPLVWMVRFYGLFVSGRRRKDYRLEETLDEAILMGGNTLIIMGEKLIY